MSLIQLNKTPIDRGWILEKFMLSCGFDVASMWRCGCEHRDVWLIHGCHIDLMLLNYDEDAYSNRVTFLALLRFVEQS